MAWYIFVIKSKVFGIVEVDISMQRNFFFSLGAFQWSSAKTYPSLYILGGNTVAAPFWWPIRTLRPTVRVWDVITFIRTGVRGRQMWSSVISWSAMAKTNGGRAWAWWHTCGYTTSLCPAAVRLVMMKSTCAHKGSVQATYYPDHSNSSKGLIRKMSNSTFRVFACWHGSSVDASIH